MTTIPSRVGRAGGWRAPRERTRRDRKADPGGRDLSPSASPATDVDTWITCDACGMEVRPDRLSQHRATQH